MAEQNEFDILRKRAQQEEQKALQTRLGSLQRRQAQIGGGPGRGAFVKQEQGAIREVQEQGQAARENIGFAEAAERRRKQEIEAQRQFAREERLGSQEFAGQQAQVGRQFAGEQSALQRRFAAEQAGVGREFAAGQASLGREFQRELTNQDLDFRRDVFTTQNENAIRQLDLAEGQLDLERIAQDFNTRIAARQFAAQLFGDRVIEGDLDANGNPSIPQWLQNVLTGRPTDFEGGNFNVGGGGGAPSQGLVKDTVAPPTRQDFFQRGS